MLRAIAVVCRLSCFLIATYSTVDTSMPSRRWRVHSLNL